MASGLTELQQMQLEFWTGFSSSRIIGIPQTHAKHRCELQSVARYVLQCAG